MTGTAQETLAKDPIAGEVKALTQTLVARPGWKGLPYPSSSAFGFMLDAKFDRAVVDTSAVAEDRGVLLEAVTEQDLAVTQGKEPGTQQPSSADPTATGSSAGQPGAADIESKPTEGETSDATKQRSDLPSSEALLSVPAGVRGRELAERACRALRKGWHEEAERLFLAAIEAAPTDPFGWFGAGLASYELDDSRTARYFEKASTYLTIDDPGGAAYAAIVSATTLEARGDPRAARRMLRDRAEELGVRTPALALHLSRLGPARMTRAGQAVAIDPLVEADLLALGLSAPEDVVRKRRSDTAEEIGKLDYSIAELKAVGNPASAEAEPRAPLPGGRLALVRTELRVLHKMLDCEDAIVASAEVVEKQAQERLQKEALVAEREAIAREDLTNLSAVPFFGIAFLLSLAMILVFAAGRALATATTLFGPGIMFITWALIASLVALAVYAFFRAWFPYRRFLDARVARSGIPHLESVVADQRFRELALRRQAERATDIARERLTAIVESRTAVVPRRPAFLADDLPLVRARQ